MGIFLGSNEISNVYVGGNTAKAVYLGSELVWPIDSGLWEYIYSYTDDTATFWSEAQEQALTIAGNHGLDYETVSVLPFGFDMADSTTSALMFMQWGGLKEVELRSTDSITSMYGMFGLCESLESVPLFDTSSVTDMDQMFYGCSSLVEVPLFDTSKVTNMGFMFAECSSLVEVELTDCSKVTYAGDMFGFQATSLERLILPGMTRGFSLRNTQMGAPALNDFFHSLGTASGSQTINITGAPGAAACDKSIATAKGWTITG